MYVYLYCYPSVFIWNSNMSTSINFTHAHLCVLPTLSLLNPWTSESSKKAVVHEGNERTSQINCDNYDSIFWYKNPVRLPYPSLHPDATLSFHLLVAVFSSYTMFLLIICHHSLSKRTPSVYFFFATIFFPLIFTNVNPHSCPYPSTSSFTDEIQRRELIMFQSKHTKWQNCKTPPL